MSKTELRTNSIIAKWELAKRLNAFAVTGLCVFVLGCLVWPLSASQFRSVSAITVAISKGPESRSELEELLARMIQEETVDDQLELMISQLEADGLVSSKTIEFRDHARIRKSLQVAIGEREYGYELRLAFDGQGGEDERELVGLLVTRIAERLNPDPVNLQARSSGSEARDDSELRLQQAQSLDQAAWMISQIGDDLKSVRFSLSRMGESSEWPTGDRPRDENQATQFKFASSQRVVAETGDLTETIDSIDLQSLRDLIEEMRQRAVAQSELVAAEPQEQTLNPGISRVVLSPSPIRTRPLNGSPGPMSLVILAFAAIGVGSFVAMKIEPFGSRGFENARTVGRKLGVPVVAQIRSDSGGPNSRVAKRSTPADRVAAISGLVLIGVIVVVGGFVMLNADVRSAFCENPFYGCVKIIRMFAGY